MPKIDDITDEKLRRIVRSILVRLSEFVEPCSTRREAERNYRDNVAQYFVIEADRWKKNYAGRDADKLLSIATEIIKSNYRNIISKKKF